MWKPMSSGAPLPVPPQKLTPGLPKPCMDMR